MKNKCLKNNVYNILKNYDIRKVIENGLNISILYNNFEKLII